MTLDPLSLELDNNDFSSSARFTQISAVLPKGIFTLQPRNYKDEEERPKGYLTYTSEGVTGRGTRPGDPNCRWMISHSVTGKQTISTLVDDVDDPFLKIENNALQTAPKPDDKLYPPSPYRFRLQVDLRSKVMKIQSDVKQSHYIGVDRCGFVVPPAFAGSNEEYAQFITPSLTDFNPPSKDRDQETVQILPTSETDKAISIKDKGLVFLSTKDDKTTHLKAISSGQGNVLYTFKSVEDSSLNLSIRAKDDKIIADEIPTSFAILKATVPGKETENDVYVLYSPDHYEFVCVKEDGHLELDPNLLPPSGSLKRLTKGPGFFHIKTLSK
ncbi:uncharacterized protein [Oscarella lobularis]|uniref:uncharacterized protein isoform X2 n=1 Tax=Oscarella lobularis TaxID=121494 RepID=UPI003313E65D